MSTQVEIIYSSSRNSKETGEIFRISPRKSARGIRPLSAKKIASGKPALGSSVKRSSRESETIHYIYTQCMRYTVAAIDFDKR